MSGENKVLLFTLLASSVLHGVFFLQGYGLNLAPLNTKEQKIEIRYLKAAQKSAAYPKQLPQYKQKQEFFSLPSRITAENRLPPRYGGSGQVIPLKPEFNKPAFAKPDVVINKKKVSLPPVDMDKINSPSYISYYQIVREKIRRAAYQNYSRTEVGEAYVSFIIANDGSLKDVHFIDEKTSSSEYLRSVALKSIYQALPFPNFPKELDYPKLSFNVIISFEIE